MARPQGVDEDGLYDPTDFNDRLLLGLKGTMSEAEIHLLMSRLHGGLINKARRGELHTRLPVGLLYDAQGQVILDPDSQVQERSLTGYNPESEVVSVSGQSGRRTGQPEQ